MYGLPMSVETERIKVTLRAFSKEEVVAFVPYFNSMKVHMYTAGMWSQTVENELKWHEKNMTEYDSAVWAVVPDGETEPVGVTSLHKIADVFGSCSSGYICYKPEWWNRGVASAAHLCRLYYAVEDLNRLTIESSVRVDNPGSRKALERIGYTVWGTDPITIQREGRFLATDHLRWLHPERKEILFPRGVPEKYVEGLAKAQIALDKARQLVKFL